jgi:hypothetical protein
MINIFHVICAYGLEISIQGNTKTSSSYIEKLVKECLELQKQESIKVEELKQCLQNSKLFSEINIEVKDHDTDKKMTGTKIFVGVKDRWSIIVFPFVQIKNDGRKSFGLFLMDSNFAGKGSVFGLGATLSTTSSGYSLFYKDKSVLMSKWTAGFSLARSISEITVKNKEEQERYAFKEDVKTYRINGAYVFNTHYTLGSSLNAKLYSYKEYHSYSSPTAFNSYSLGFDFTVNYDHFKFYYQEGWRTALALEKEFLKSPQGSHPLTLWWQTALAESTISDQVFQTAFCLTKIANGDSRDKIKSGGRGKSVGLRGTPDGVIYTDLLAGLSFDYQIPLKHSSYGTWTAAPFTDLAYLHPYGLVNETMMNFSYGAGAYLFLKGIIIPGLGFIGGYNQSFGHFFLEFSIGSSF